MANGVSPESADEVYREVSDFDRSLLSNIRVDHANSSILVKDEVTGAEFKYADTLSKLPDARGKWSYTCKFGEFRDSSLIGLAWFIREDGLLSETGWASSKLHPEIVDLGGIKFINSLGGYIHLGSIYEDSGQWIVGLPRVVGGSVSRNSRKYKSFPSYTDAYNYSRFYIMSIMHNYSFPSLAAEAASIANYLHESEFPKRALYKPLAERERYAVPKCRLIGVYFLIFSLASYALALKIGISYFPYLPLASAFASWAYVSGAIAWCPHDYFTRGQKYISYKTRIFPILGLVFSFLHAVFVSTAHKLAYWARFINPFSKS